MRAALVEEPGRPLNVVDDVDLDPPGEGEVLVRVEHCGLCHSDLHFIDGSLPGPLPLLLGHEAGGVVEEVGAGVLGLAPGDKVILTLRPPCGRCYWCVRGEFSQCGPGAALTAGIFPDGGTRLSRGGAPVYRSGVVLAAFAERTVVPAEAAVKVAADTPLEIAAVLGCAVQTGVGAVINTAKVQVGDTVMIVGLGGVGISIAQGARLAGASRVIGVDPIAGRREQALSFGVTDVVDPAAGSPSEAALALTVGIGVDHAFDAVGRASIVESLFPAVRNGGAVVMVGVPPIQDVVNVHAIGFGLVEKKLVGCFLGSANPHREFPRLLELWRAGRLDLEGMVTARRPLAEINQAVTDMQAGVGLRTVLSL
ncbi:MAG: Zn-dependent alcohol dehydrogenase [Acidimicrobiales bacterium]|nr:Zn-dependent alcohol dehydrogenase [Acidimicrobiales bacterium]